MTREEQITNVAKTYAAEESKATWDYPVQEVEWAFQEGANWANSHPNWHKFPDEKPTENKQYIVCYTDKDIFIDTWDIDYGEWCGVDNECVIGFMELPQAPKFD